MSSNSCKQGCSCRRHEKWTTERRAKLRGDREDIADRFINRIEFSDGCWEFRRSPSQIRYAPFAFLEVDGTRVLRGAHRMMWEMVNFEAVPEGMLVCHTCDNPPCVRPEHLFLGTQGDNLRDAAVKGRLGQNSAIRGEK